MRLERVRGQVDYIVTDSPILLSAIYSKGNPESFRQSIVDIFKEMNNANYFILRHKEYVEQGRNQTEAESKEIDDKLLRYLTWNEVDVTKVDGNEDAADKILAHLGLTSQAV